MATDPTAIAPPAAPQPANDPNAAVYDAIRRADAVGDADAVARLSLYLKQQHAPAPIADSGTTMGFAEDAPTEASRQLSEEDSATFYKMLRGDGMPKASADELRRFVGSKGLQLDNAEQIVAQRDKGQGVVGQITYPLPKVENIDGGAGSFARGATDTLTFGTQAKLGAGIAGIESAIKGDGFSDAYHEMLDHNNGVIASDEAAHPIYRIAGQLLAGLPLPAGTEGVAFKAGRAALRDGATLQEARAIGMAAVRNRLAATGGIYGAAHGAGSADDIPGAIKGAAIEGALGATAGVALGNVGQYIDPSIQASRVAARTGNIAPDIDYAALAQRLGITPTPATTGGAMAHATQVALGNTPGGMSAVAGAVGHENNQLGEAAKRAAESVGTVSTRPAAGEALAAGANAYEQSSKVAAKALYKARDAAFGGETAPVDAAETRDAFQDIANNFPTSAAVAQLNEHPVLRKLLDAATTGKPLTLAEATEALSHVRGVARNLAGKGDATGPVLARVSKVEQALENDVMNAGKAADRAAGRIPGDPGSAVDAQKAADAFYADRKAALNGSLKNARASFKDSIKVSGEQLFNQVSNDMARVGGNLQRLRDTWFRLPEDARQTFAATKLDDMGRSLPGQQNDAGAAWSFNRFLTNFDTMSPQARRITFGKDVEPQVRDIAAYASRLRDLDKSRNFSNTAKHLISGGILTALSTALWHGNYAEAGELAGATAALWPTAKLYMATPAMRAWTKSALRLGLMPPAKAEAQGAVLLRRLGAVARAEPAIANDVLSLQSHLSRMLESGGSAPLAAQDKKDGGAVKPQPQADDKPYREWLQKYGIREDPTYDTRAAFQHGLTPDARGHLNDAYKLPNHPTFSDESIHNGEGGKAGGKWVDKGGGKWDFQASPWNLQNMSKPKLKAYFDHVEPGSTIIFPDGERYTGKAQ